MSRRLEGSAAATKDERAVDLWYFDLDVGADDQARCARTVDADERARAERFVREEHARRFIAWRGTLRMILARYVGCRPEDVRLEHGPHGKPYLAPTSRADRLWFNASNSAGLGGVALARHAEVGFDLEEIRPGVYERGVVEALAPDERGWLESLHESEQPVSFYRLWTCKEAYLKGRGCGLSERLDRFAIRLEAPSAARLVWSAIDPADPERWELTMPSTRQGFSACVAVAARCSEIRIRTWPRAAHTV